MLDGALDSLDLSRNARVCCGGRGWTDGARQVESDRQGSTVVWATLARRHDRCVSCVFSTGKALRRRQTEVV
jgi:hypothetical protein